MNQIILNGKNVYSSKSITINNNKIILDDDIIDCSNESEINILVTGNIESLKTYSGIINVTGNVDSIKSMSGDISIKGDITGDVKTTSGNIKCGSVNGSIKTISGNVKNK